MWSIPPDSKKAVLDIIKEHGHDPMDFLDIDMDAIRKLWKKGVGPAFFDKLKDHLITTKSVRFDSRKA